MKWAAIQPLSGGIIFAGNEVFPNPAEYIISFPGLDLNDEKSCPNEYPVLKYLSNKKICPPYWQFKEGMFDIDPNNMNPEFINSSFTPNEYLSQEEKDNKINNENIDVVFAVPVCSGLSAANVAEQKTEFAVNSIKNNNMKFITKFVLNRIKPKVYVFENAPALYTNKGKEVRDILNKFAEDEGYTITYVKTNSNLHDNVQYRERTFAIFWNKDYQKIPPKIEFKHITHESVSKYLIDNIDKKATQNDINKDSVSEQKLEDFFDYKYIKYKYGNKWREKVSGNSLQSYIVFNNLDKECIQYTDNDKLTHPIAHARYKVDQGLSFYDRSRKIITDKSVPTLFHKTIADIVHPTEERFFTLREIMTLMGLPQDYEWPWSKIKFCQKIGQNVPVRTAKDILLEIKRIIEIWNSNKEAEYPESKYYSNVYFYNNICPEKSYFMKK